MSLFKKGLIAIGMIFLLMLGVVVSKWIPWRFNKTKTTFQPLDLYLEEYRQNPPTDRAWEMLRAMSVTRRYSPTDDMPLSNVWPPKRGDPLYEEGVAFAKDRASELAAIREACGKKVFGYDYPDAESDWPEEAILMPHLGASRAITRLLAMDTRVAMDERDYDRAIENIHALLNLSELLWQHPNKMAQLVSIPICVVACNEISRMADGGFDELSNEQVEGLIARFASLNVDSFQFDTTSTRRCFDFHMQRVFSDTGDNDGRICSQGAHYLCDLANSDTKTRNGILLGTLAIPSKLPTRNEAREQGELLLTRMEEWYAIPLWERPAHDVPHLQGATTLYENMMVLCIAPVLADLDTLDRVTTSSIMGDTRRHAVRIALVAELHRRKTGSLPETLEQIRDVLGGSLPVDPFTGEPLKYLVRDGKVVVYSVGNDRDDDGGRAFAEDGSKAAKWCPAGDEDVVVDADYLVFPQVD